MTETTTVTTNVAACSLTPDLKCSLKDLERGERLTWFRQSLLPAAVERREIDGGVQILFARSDAMRAQIEAFISLERNCCGFASFEIAEDPAGEYLRLDITGSVRVQGVIRQMADDTLSPAVR